MRTAADDYIAAMNQQIQASTQTPGFWQQPPVQAALVNVAVVLVVAVIGWIVTAKIARLARDAAAAVAEVTAGITRQQLEVARNQYEVNRQNLVLTLLPRRIELKQALLDAIDARGREITGNDYQKGDISSDALHALRKAQAAAEVLFGADVTTIVEEVLKQLDLREKGLLKIRTDLLRTPADQPRDYRAHDEVAAAALRVETLKGELSLAMDRYSAMGDVRMAPASPVTKAP